jgi:hypothetical protein
MKRGNKPEHGGCVKLCAGMPFSIYHAALSSKFAASPRGGVVEGTRGAGSLEQTSERHYPKKRM